MGEENETPAETRAEAIARRIRPDPKPWNCPHCGDRVPGKAKKCLECGTPKPKRGK